MAGIPRFPLALAMVSMVSWGGFFPLEVLQ